MAENHPSFFNLLPPPLSSGAILSLVFATSLSSAFEPARQSGLPSVGGAALDSARGQGEIRDVRPPSPAYEDRGDTYRYKGATKKVLRHPSKWVLFYREGRPSDSTAFRRRLGAFSDSMTFSDLGKSVGQTLRVLDLGRSANPAEALSAATRNEPGLSAFRPMYFDADNRVEFTVSDILVVKHSFPDRSGLLGLAASVDAEIRETRPGNIVLLRLRNPGSDPLAAANRLDHQASVAWAEPEMLFQPKRFFVPNDPWFPRQQHLRNSGQQGGSPGADIRAEQAWDVTRGDTSIVIAVIDDGVQTNHPDLVIAPGGRNFYAVPPTDDPNPVNAIDNHGTAVAGVAAARGNNGVGTTGIAPNARILPIKIMEGKAMVSSEAIGAAIKYAADAGADVLSNSWGYAPASTVINEAIVYASTQGRGGRGCPVLFASGNDASEFRSMGVTAGSGTYYVSFRYGKNGSVSEGEDLAAIDNVKVVSPDGYTVLFQESFAGGLPAGWTTPVPETGIPWIATGAMSYGGLGEQVSMRSGLISHSQGSQLMMPLRTYAAGEVIHLQYKVSSQAGGDYFYFGSCNQSRTSCSHQGDGSTTGIFTRSQAIGYPASADSSIVVGASTDRDFRAGYSQYDVAGTGKTVDFLAPSDGGWNGITTTDRTGAAGYGSGDNTWDFGGTSAATPLASGLAALILSRNPNLTRNEVLSILRSTADKVGGRAYSGGWNTEYGWGRLNAYQALLTTPPPIPPPPAPLLSSPANGATDQPLTRALAWNAATGAASYRLQLSTTSSFVSLVVDDSTLAGTSRGVGPLTSGTTYFWRVNAKNAGGTSAWSATWSFTTLPAAPSVPVLTSPANGSTDQPPSLTLSWNSSARAATYRLQVATDAGFSNLAVNDGSLTGTSRGIGPLANSTTYYWRVSASNTGDTSPFSAAWSFTTLPPVPPAPTLASPASDAVNQPLILSLAWNEAPGASSYRLQLSTSPAFASMVMDDSTLNATSRAVGPLAPGTLYYWRVNARNAAGTSDWSGIRAFATIPSAPLAPTLALPTHGAVGQPLSPTLVWNASARAATYRLQVAYDAGFSGMVADVNHAGTSRTIGLPAPATTYYWRVNAANAGGTSGWSETWAFTTTTPIDHPAVADAGPDREVDENRNLSFSVIATDSDGDSIALSALNLPRGAVFNDSSGVAFTWNPNRPMAISCLHAMGNILFAGTYAGGLYRSRDNGQNWTWAGIGLTGEFPVRFLASMNEVLFAAIPGEGVYRSSDYGRSWRRANSGLTNIQVIALHSMGGALFAGTNGGGVFRTHDQGDNWLQVNSGLPPNCMVTTLHSIGSTLFAGASGSSGTRGVYRSENNGDSWSVRGGSYSVHVLHSMGGILFSGMSGGVFRSSDNGSRWVSLGNGLPSGDFHTLYSMGGALFAGSASNGVFRSLDNGDSWIPVGGGFPPHGGVTSLHSIGGTLVAGASSGVYRSSDNGDSWTLGSHDSTRLRVLSVCSMGGSLFAATFGDGVYRSSDNGTSWTGVNNGLTSLNISSLQSMGGILIAGTIGSGVFRSFDNGESWRQDNAGLTNLFVNALHIVGNLLFAATYDGVFRSLDNGNSWIWGASGIPVSTPIHSLHSLGGILFAGTSGRGIFRSSDDGGSWTQASTGLPSSTSVLVHSLHSAGGALFAGIYGGVYRSLDTGGSWVNTGLANLAVTSLFSMQNTLFAGTGTDGTYRSLDNGSSWVRFSPALANTYVTSFHAMGNVLFAGTDGWGVVRLQKLFTGTFSWTPDFNQAGTYPLIFRASSNGMDTLDTITVTVKDVARPPVFTPIPDTLVVEGELIRITLHATDPDGDSAIYSQLPPMLGTLSGNTYSWTSTYSDSGSHTLRFLATAGNLADTLTVNLRVLNRDRPPTMAPGRDTTVAENQPLAFDVSATDPDGDAVTMTALDLPSGATFSPSSGAFAWVTSYDQAGTHILLFRCESGSPALADTDTVVVTVANVDRSPVFASIPDTSVQEAEPLQLTLRAQDPDAVPVSLSALNLPSGAVFASATGVFAWTPSFDQAGTYALLFRAQSGNPALADTDTVVVTVTNVDRSPVFTSIPDTAVGETELLRLSLQAVDPDGDLPTYSQLPPVVGSLAGNVFSWTPTHYDAGDYILRFVAAAGGLSDTLVVHVRVVNRDRSPALAPIGPERVDEGRSLIFTVTAADSDGDAVSVRAQGLPRGATFDGATFAWTPDLDQAGAYSVLFIATANGLSDSESVPVTVDDAGTGRGTIRLISGSAAPGTAFLAMAAGSGEGSLLGYDSVEVTGLAPGWYTFAARRDGHRIAHFAVAARPDSVVVKRISPRPSAPLRFRRADTLRVDGAPFTVPAGAALAVGDLDSDGREDLAVFSPSGISLLINRGLSPERGRDFTASSRPLFPGMDPRLRSAFFTDWNSDGNLDLLAADYAGRISVRYGGDSGFGVPRILLTRSGESLSVLVEDWESDGRPDLWAHSEGHGLYVYRNIGPVGNPDLDPSPIEILDGSGSGLGGPGAPLMLDVDGDGVKDWVSAEGERLGYRAMRRQGWYRDAAEARNWVNVGGEDRACSGCVLSATVPENGMPRLLVAEPGRHLVSHSAGLLGDLNGDGAVDLLDLGLLADAWELDDSDTAWNPDFNLVVEDGAESIDVLDLGKMADSWEWRE